MNKIWRCDLTSPCVKLCESENNKHQCGINRKKIMNKEKIEKIKRDIRKMIVCDDFNFPIECVLVKVDLITFEADIVCSGLISELSYLSHEHNTQHDSYAFVISEFPDIYRQLDVGFQNILKHINKK